MPSYPPPICISCTHLDPKGLTCKAFGKMQIPQAILLSMFDHRKPYPGDSAIQFQQDPTKPVPPFSTLFPE